MPPARVKRLPGGSGGRSRLPRWLSRSRCVILAVLHAPYGSRADGGFPGNPRSTVNAGKGHNEYMPFSRLGLNDDLLRSVKDLGFTQPTPIQEAAIPPAVQGRDVMACAMTGTGKTAAFVLPALHRLAGKPRGKTRVLVLTPTRELAGQIHEHLGALANHTRIRAAAVFGGVGMKPQEDAMRRGVDVLVATPGRLLDHLRFPYARLDAVELLVLDEADRMLDMGFLPDVRRILARVPSQRQTLFFSATLPPAITKLAREMLSNPELIDLARGATPAVGITHTAYPVPSELKSGLLLELLRRDTIRSVIVFTRTKHRANRLADYLLKQNVSTVRIHGNRSQSQRNQALAEFKAGRHRVLVATDVAARGIDVEDLSHVVNFDVPASPEDYVHRAGRTARAEATGDALLFVSPEEEASLRAIERIVGKRVARATVPGFDYTKRAEKLEIPLAQRLATMRLQRAAARERTRARASVPPPQARHARRPHSSAGGFRRVSQ
jgi:ATP-dependent RNA helicase RhlE